MVGHGVVEGLVHEPHAGEGVSLDQYNCRSQPGLLKARGEQHCSVHAGAELTFKQVLRGSDLLTGLLETRRRVDVADFLAHCRVVDRSSFGVRAARIAALVSRQRAILRLFQQQLRRLGKDTFYGGVVGKYMRSDDFR